MCACACACGAAALTRCLSPAVRVGPGRPAGPLLVRQLLEREEDERVGAARGRRVSRQGAGGREEPLSPPPPPHSSATARVRAAVAFRYTETSADTRPKEKRTLFLMNTGAFTSALQPYLFPHISFFYLK